MSIRYGTNLTVWREDCTDVQRSMSWEQPKQTAVHPFMRKADSPRESSPGPAKRCSTVWRVFEFGASDGSVGGAEALTNVLCRLCFTTA